MRTDLEYARAILMQVLDFESPTGKLDERAILGEKHNDENARRRFFHAYECVCDAGYVCGTSHAIRLTWNGHEFAENIANDAVWEEVKRRVDRLGGSVALSELEYLAKFVALELAGAF